MLSMKEKEIMGERERERERTHEREGKENKNLGDTRKEKGERLQENEEWTDRGKEG